MTDLIVIREETSFETKKDLSGKKQTQEALN